MIVRPALLMALLGLIFGMSARGQSLEREVAASLIAEANQIREKEVTVGPMLAAERKIDQTTTLTGAICVTFIAPVIENGGRPRKVQTRTFFYDPEWGWYLYSVENDLRGAAIDIVSQHRGRIVLR